MAKPHAASHTVLNDLYEMPCGMTYAMQEQSSGEAWRLQSPLDKRDTALLVKQQELQQGQAQLEEAHTQVQALQSEVELLRIKLENEKKNDGLLMRPLVALQQERKNLTKQLKQLQLDNQQLRVNLQKSFK